MIKYIVFLFLSLFISIAYADGYTDATHFAAMHKAGIAPQSLTTIDNPTVRMVVFTTYNGYKISDTQLSATIWTTVEPELKHLCHQYVTTHKNISSHDLAVWIAQLLGLPENTAEKRRFVVLDMPSIQAYYGQSPSTIGIFRPCTDPRITHHSDDTPACPKLMNAQDPYISSDFKSWFINNSISSYTETNGAPWTEYGYTYNWNPEAANPYGVAEFVVLKNTPARVLSNPVDSSTAYLTPEEYCQ